jgi:Zn-dependent protease
VTEPAPHFRIAGVPVHVRPLFYAIPFVGAVSQPARVGLIWVVVVTVGVLWHELGHALAMRRFGFEPRIELVAMGGLTFWPEDARPSAGAAFLVSLAGPVAGLALGGVTWFVARAGGEWSSLAEIAFRQALWVNVGWSLVNLLPVIPFDGSALLDHGSRALGGAPRPRWVGAVSLLVGAGGALVAIQHHMTWAAMLGGLGAAAGWERLRGSVGAGSGQAAARRPNAWEGEPAKLRAARLAARAAGDRGDRRAVLSELLPFVRSDRLEAADLALLASALVAGGEAATLRALCVDRLEASPGAGSTAMLVSAATDELLDAGILDEALLVRRTAFEVTGAPFHAYEAALCLARQGKGGEAVEWLRRSIEAGLDGAAALLADPGLASLAGREDFALLLERVRDEESRRGSVPLTR